MEAAGGRMSSIRAGEGGEGPGELGSGERERGREEHSSEGGEE